MAILVHVDNCTISSNSLDAILIFKKAIQDHVEITDMDELHWLLGLKIKRNRENHTLGPPQRAYIESILCHHNLETSQTCIHPMETSMRLSTVQSPKTTLEITVMCDKLYCEAVSALMYAALGTRPDISYAVQCISHFSINSGIEHWDAVECIF